jgi:cysteinyl-tRNA synthetase
MLTVLYDVLKDNELTDFTKLYLIEDFDKVLSLGLTDEEEVSVDEDRNEEILKKIEERNEAKKNKDYAKADQIRDELLKEGIKLIDSREGTTYEII